MHSIGNEALGRVREPVPLCFAGARSRSKAYPHLPSARPLTCREAHVMIAGCVIPIIGGWLVDQAYEHHVLWAPDEPRLVAVKVKRRHARR